jgi:hypothetical protein
MAEAEEEAEEDADEDVWGPEDQFWELAGNFLRDNQRPIGKLIEAFAGQIEKRFPFILKSLYAVFFVTVFAIVAASLLGWAGVISGDAVAFLFGSLIAYLFAFLKERFPF